MSGRDYIVVPVAHYLAYVAAAILGGVCIGWLIWA
jgi:hypothetical protein